MPADFAPVRAMERTRGELRLWAEGSDGDHSHPVVSAIAVSDRREHYQVRRSALGHVLVIRLSLRVASSTAAPPPSSTSASIIRPSPHSTTASASWPDASRRWVTRG